MGLRTWIKHHRGPLKSYRSLSTTPGHLGAAKIPNGLIAPGPAGTTAVGQASWDPVVPLKMTAENDGEKLSPTTPISSWVTVQIIFPTGTSGK